MSSYGWTAETVFSHTLYQLENFYGSINRRKYDDYIMLTNISRVSQADKDGYTKFLENLNKAKEATNTKPKDKNSIPNVNYTHPALEGFRVVN